jgi:hypothetical protein
VRSTRSIEILCLALAALVLVWSHALSAQLWPVVGLLAAFALAIAAFRSRRFFPGRTRTRLLIESWSMVIFITGALWFSGKSASPLLNLYLLPIILSAFTLGRLVTLLQVAVIFACHFVLAMASPGVDVMSLVYASQAVGQLAPFLLVAFLTTILSDDITEARERIEDLAQNDALTGLFNLRMFNEVWKREHDASERDRGVYALLLIDMDRLKDINDSFGHEAGNSAITLVAKCLQRSIGVAAGRHARDRRGGGQTSTPQCLQDHARSAFAHDSLQRQHRRGELPEGFTRHARAVEHGGPQDVSRQGAAPRAGQRDKCLKFARQYAECAGHSPKKWQS